MVNVTAGQSGFGGEQEKVVPRFKKITQFEHDLNLLDFGFVAVSLPAVVPRRVLHHHMMTEAARVRGVVAHIGRVGSGGGQGVRGQMLLLMLLLKLSPMVLRLLMRIDKRWRWWLLRGETSGRRIEGRRIH